MKEQILIHLNSKFFSPPMDGQKIPIVLLIQELSKNFDQIFLQCGVEIYSLKFDNISSMQLDKCFDFIHHKKRKIANVPLRITQEFYQKNARIAANKNTKKILMLNDSHLRQNINQIYELMSLVCGFDQFRMKGILKLPFSLCKDLLVLMKFDKVYVQTAAERKFLKRIFLPYFNKIEIFSNFDYLYKNHVNNQSDERERKIKYLVTFPNDINRQKECKYFLQRLQRSNFDMSKLTILDGTGSSRDFVNGCTFVDYVDNFNDLLANTENYIIPTYHYTGLNNRLIFGLTEGCKIYCTSHVLDGLKEKLPQETICVSAKSLKQLVNRVVQRKGNVEMSHILELEGL